VGRLLQLMLARQGYGARLAPNADLAWQLLQRERFGAVLLDLMLPGRDGVTLLRQIRGDAGLQELPVIVVSAAADRARQRLEASALQVLDWLPKPIDQERLHAALLQAREAEGPVRILHVEDDADVAEVVAARISFELPGAEVASVATLADARAHLREQAPDLVVLDLMLPDGNGLELLVELGQQRPPIPVVIFSALELGTQVRSNLIDALVKSRHGEVELVERLREMLPR